MRLVPQFISKRFWGLIGGSTGFAYTADGGRMMRALDTTTAGPTINEQTALTLPAFLHAIRLYGQTLGSLDWNLIQVEDRGRTVARSHPVHRLLHDDPNEFQLACEFRETIVATAIAYGNGYAFIERNGNFRPTALLPLLSDRTYPVRYGGQLKYVTYVNGSQQTLEPYEVFHLKGFGMNGMTGLPLVRLMAETLGLSKAEEAFAAAFFGNGANAGGVVEVAGTLNEAAMKNLRDSFQLNHAGLGNAFRTLFLEEGHKYTPFQVDAAKSQMVESRSFQLGDLARVVGLPPHLLFDLTKSSFSNIETQGIEAVTYAFRPWANKLCQEARRKLLYQSEQDAYEPTIDLKPLMTGDAKSIAETNQIKLNCQAITPNEIRAQDSRNPIAGGDQLFLNQASLPLDVAVQRALAQIEQARAATVKLLVGTAADPTTAAIDAALIAATGEGKDTAPADPITEPTPQGNALFNDGPPGVAKEEEDFDAVGGTAAFPGRSLPRNGEIRIDGPHSYGCVMAPIDGDAADAITSLANSIPDDELADDGRETDPHVTVLYGLHGDQSDDVAECLRDAPPVAMTLGKTKVFPATADRQSDVVVAAVDSPDLHSLNDKLKALPNTSTYPEYVPHATIAYVKPGFGQKYAGRSVHPDPVTVTALVHASPAGVKTKIPLGTAGPIVPARSLRPIAVDTVSRLIRRDAKSIATAVKKDARDGSGKALAKWIADYETQSRSTVVAALTPLAETLKTIGRTIDVDAVARSFVDGTLVDISKLTASPAADRADELSLIAEGWKSGRADELVARLIGEPKP